MVIYEWRDVKYLGIATEPDNILVPVSHYKAARNMSANPSNMKKTYVCTSDAVRAKLCSESQLGRFILNLKGLGVENTTIWSASIGFRDQSANSTTTTNSTASVGTSSGFWDNPKGNPTPPPSEWDSPWRRLFSDTGVKAVREDIVPRRVNNTVVPSGVLWYSEPILYQVEKKGYYCVGM